MLCFFSKYNFSATQGGSKRKFSHGIKNGDQFCESPSKRQKVRLKNNDDERNQTNQNKDSMSAVLKNELFEELEDFFKQNTSESRQEKEDEDFDSINLRLSC